MQSTQSTLTKSHSTEHCGKYVLKGRHHIVMFVDGSQRRDVLKQYFSDLAIEMLDDRLGSTPAY